LWFCWIRTALREPTVHMTRRVQKEMARPVKPNRAKPLNLAARSEIIPIAMTLFPDALTPRPWDSSELFRGHFGYRLHFWRPIIDPGFAGRRQENRQENKSDRSFTIDFVVRPD